MAQKLSHRSLSLGLRVEGINHHPSKNGIFMLETTFVLHATLSSHQSIKLVLSTS